MYTQKEKITSFIRLIVGLILLLIIFIALFSVVRQATLPVQGALSTPGSISTSTQSPISLQQERETIEAAVMQTRFALIDTWTPQPPPTGRPPTYTPVPFISGIYEISSAPVCFPPGRVNCSVSSVWKDIVNGERIMVYAGARVDLSSATPVKTQGLVIVKVYSKDLSNRITLDYEAPGITGMLKIVAANGYRLTLHSQNGDTLYFDVPTRQFVSDLTVVITAPTTTPFPPITPTNTPDYPATLVYPLPSWNPFSTDYPQPSTNTPPSTAQP